MSSGGSGRLSRDQKRKVVARATESSHARVVESNSPSDFETIHREAMLDTSNMDTLQRVLVAESASNSRRERGCCDLPALAPELTCSPILEGQTWGNIEETRLTPSSVKILLRTCGGAGVTFLIPTKAQRPWSPPVGFQCVYESYFQNETKLWFPIPRLVTSYARRRDAAISQFLSGAFRNSVALMVAAAEINVSMSVRTLEELTYLKSMGDGLYSIQMRPNYNVIVDHPSRTNNWQRFYFYVKPDSFAFEEPPGDSFRFLWNHELVDHSDSAFYLEEFIANARTVASLAQVSWKDITVERIRRAVDRISKKDWGSDLPPLITSNKWRFSIFTRAEQKVINAAREMKELPDLSVLIKKKLSGAKKTPSATPSETTPSRPSSLAVTPGPFVDPVNIESSREEAAESSVTDGNKKKRSAPDSSTSVEADAPIVPLERKKNLPVSETHPFPLRGLLWWCLRRPGVVVQYDGDTPLAYAPSECAELVRHIRGGAKNMPPVKDLFFKDAYVDAARTKILVRSDGSMNYVVELYDTSLKETISKLTQADKLMRVKDAALNRKTREFKAMIDKTAAERSRVNFGSHNKFGELKGKFKAAGEKIRGLEHEKAALEKEKVAWKGEKVTTSLRHLKEINRRRDSRRYEVTHERVRVQTAMIAKCNKCFTKIRDLETRRSDFEIARSLQSQAFGTKKCLEALKESGIDIPQETIDLFAEQEKEFEEEANRLTVGGIPEELLCLSPLHLPSPFLNENVLAEIDPYGSNANLIDAGTADMRPRIRTTRLRETSRDYPFNNKETSAGLVVNEEPSSPTLGISDATLTLPLGEDGAGSNPVDLLELSDSSAEEDVGEKSGGENSDEQVPDSNPQGTEGDLVESSANEQGNGDEVEDPSDPTIDGIGGASDQLGAQVVVEDFDRAED
ncbi:meiosis-specific protein ASY2-like [Brassica napus]|uniref:meiosis-specific protein ASY2-like n=1 Tax=Brassica napus TaxID=3708 RepID=UPI0006AA7AD8|nr:meiosis-specific protein ASY2-like [Brassica napus]